MATVAPYGSWRSPITPQLLVAQAVGLSQVEVDGSRVLWNEARPSEAGRQVLVAVGPDGKPEDLLEHPSSARTLVHEYGGRCFASREGTVVFSNMADQRLWLLPPGGSARPLTADPESPRSVRFADPVITPDGRWVICVRERHGTQVVNDIVALPLAVADGPAEPH